MDVLFVDLPFNTYELGRKFKAAWSYKQVLSPFEIHLGFRYMVAALRASGNSADIVFPAVETGLRTRTDLVKAIAEIRPRVLGFTSYEGSLRESIRFIRRLKAAGVDALIVMGGHLATFSYREILADHGDLIDLIVLGEGEDAMVEIMEAARQERGFTDIPGLAFHDGDRLVVTPHRPVKADIDWLPFPVLPDFGTPGEVHVPLFLTTSRGCYGRCSFCRSSHFGERWRARDPGRVVDEIELAYARGVRIFEIVDDNFLGPGIKGRRRAEEVAAEILRRQLQIRFHVSCRVNDVQEHTMAQLKEAGLVSVSLGVESGVQRMLDSFQKDVTVEQNLVAVELLQRLSIPALAYIIFFDPYTTLTEAAENLAFLERLRALGNVRFEAILFRKFIPISGTALFERIRGEGLLRGNYLDGHRFVFRDPAVSVLADFMETIDLRFERLMQDEAVRRIPDMYAIKESLEFHMMRKSIALLLSRRWKTQEAFGALNDLLSTELRSALGAALPSTEPVLVDA